MDGRKYRSRELLNATFLSPKKTKKADRFHMKFSSIFNISVQRRLYPLFQNQRQPFSAASSFSKNVSEFASRIHPLIFLWSPKGFISPEYFLDFFSNLYIPPWLRKSFKFMTLRWLENTFLRQKIESVHFYSYPQGKLPPRSISSLLQTEGNYPFPLRQSVLKTYCSPTKRGRTMGLKYDQN